MIASISGEVLVRRPDHVVLDTGGVGYRLAVSAETLRSVPAPGSPFTLFSQMVVRDDDISLYGFATEEERDLFVMLISVNKVGPKVAIATLSGGPVRDLVMAIASGDVKHFKSVPGIGPKTAQLIIVTLRDKVGELEAGEIEITRTGAPDSPRGEAREGLIGLGYTPAEAEKLLAEAEGESAEELIQEALRAGAGAVPR